MTLELALGRSRIAVKRELSEHGRRQEWGGAGEQSAASKFRHN